MSDVPLTNLEAERLADQLEDQGGAMHDEVKCPRCRNYTLGDVSYGSRLKPRFATVCLICDAVKDWPRMAA